MFHSARTHGQPPQEPPVGPLVVQMRDVSTRVRARSSRRGLRSRRAGQS
jgi:hypothetical protein